MSEIQDDWIVSLKQEVLDLQRSRSSTAEGLDVLEVVVKWDSRKSRKKKLCLHSGQG